MPSSLVISLIGMSGSGKSYWAQRLAQEGFRRFCCDDLIEEKLSPQLKKLGFKGIADVAKWLGQPYEKRYKERAACYLFYEKQVLSQIIKNIKQGLKGNTVIDTTGSVIYTGKRICQQLKNYTKVVYLSVPTSIRKEMFRQYLKDPKPVIWGKIFNQKGKETKRESLIRCYPKLLNYRRRIYKHYADITVDYRLLRKKGFAEEKFINLILKYSI